MAGWQDPVKGTTCGCMKFLRIERPGRWVAIRQIPPRKAECPRLSLNYRHRSGVCVIAELPRLHTRIKFNCHRGPKTFNFAGRKFSIFISHLLDGGKEVAHAARLICLHKSCSNASHLRRRIPIGE